MHNIYQSDCRQELSGIFSGWRIWFILAWNDIKLRYRRSSLGPFWITLSTAVRIYCMGFLFAHLFKVDVNKYFPYLAAGIISWTTISTVINEATTVFIESETYIRNIKISFTHLVMRLVIKNFIIFAHNILAYIPILLYFDHTSSEHYSLLNHLILIPNLLLLMTVAVLFGTILAILGTRFRDMPLLVDSMVQVVFFMTPVMWMPDLLPERYQWIVYLNPIHHIVEFIRAPMIGAPVELFSYGILSLIIIVGLLGFNFLINKCKYRIIFWL